MAAELAAQRRILVPHGAVFVGNEVVSAEAPVRHCNSAAKSRSMSAPMRAYRLIASSSTRVVPYLGGREDSSICKAARSLDLGSALFLERPKHTKPRPWRGFNMRI